MTKIDNTGIISKKIITDNLYNTQGEKYLTPSDFGSLQEILDNAVQQATEDATEAKVLAETAALNALESERNVTVRAEEIISQVTSEAKEAKVLAEAAAINALESEQNINAGDFVIETYNDGENWYRLYKSGWIEQGGTYPSSNVSSSITLTLPTPFTTTNYVVMVTGNGNVNAYAPLYNTKTTTSFSIFGHGGGGGAGNWYACGI